MVQKLILGIITVILAIVIGFTLYINVGKNTTLFSNKTPTPSPTSSQPSLLGEQTQKTTDSVKVFFIALNDNGKKGKRVGCADSVVGTAVKVAPTSDPLTAALNSLFAVREQTDPGSKLFNALYQSDLHLQSVSVGKGGVANVVLLGTQAISGNCEDPRIISQIKETAMQFPSVTGVAITINGYPIEQLLPGNGQ